MRFSTRSRYAARALVELALVGPEATLSVRDVADRQQISPKYLEQIFSTLKAAGLVRAVRGLNGGYTLAKPAPDIPLKELFDAIEGSLAPVDCVDQPEGCPRGPTCPTRQTWLEIKEAIDGVLRATTIEELANRQRRKQQAATAPLMYHI